ncbi:MAG: hypothetical protein AB8B85_23525 [Paracoccaceae bacterium]
MSDQKKAEPVADEDLDDVQGGLLQFEIQMNKKAPTVRKDSGEAHLDYLKSK